MSRGTWYDPEPGRNAAFLYQQNTLRDGLVAALSLSVFHRHADRVRMTAIAQMVNVLQAMILTEQQKMVLTPTYHVFDMYVPFQGATHLPSEVNTPPYVRGEWSIPAVDVSAARGVDGRIHVALVNSDPNQSAIVTAKITGASARDANGRVLTAAAMDARNTFEQPTAIQPAPYKATRVREGMQFRLPPKSVVVVELTD
jgi:alpha-L-arabinofuranosidase